MPTSHRSPSTDQQDAAEQEALDWLLRCDRGLSPAEKTHFSDWLRASPVHEQALEYWQKEWAMLDALPPSSIAQIRANLDRDQAEHIRRSRITRRNALALTGTALGSAGLGVLVWQQRQQPLWQQAFTSRRGEQLELNLPDGSRLRVDTATRLHARFYRNRRDITLHEGQAAFAVAQDAKRPFHVATSDALITVIGTRFSVRHTPGFPDLPGTNVAVGEGRVQIQAITSEDQAAEGLSITLNPGERIASNGQGQLGSIQPTSTTDIATWIRQRLSFDNIPLRQAIAELERYGDTRLRLGDARAGDLRITGTFSARDLSNFRIALPRILPVRLVASSDGWTEILMRG